MTGINGRQSLDRKGNQLDYKVDAGQEGDRLQVWVGPSQDERCRILYY